VHSRALQSGLQKYLGSNYAVEIGMRYGNPSIFQALHKFKTQNVEEIILIPLYPQYARATTESTFNKVNELIKTHGFDFKIRSIGPFFDSKNFIEAKARRIQNHVGAKKVDHFLMTYHGLPESQNSRMDPPNSYREQCIRTSELLAKELGLQRSQWSFSFQSRLGKTEWIKPYTDQTLKKLAAQGVQSVAVVCPSFVADCLETIEEIGVEGARTFKEAGGSEFHLVPCLNEQADYLMGFF
jgi:ferrochelatase